MGLTMITKELTQMIIDLRSEGLDCYQIARKLDVNTVEVERIVYGDNKLDPEILEMVHWGVHY